MKFPQLSLHRAALPLLSFIATVAWELPNTLYSYAQLPPSLPYIRQKMMFSSFTTRNRLRCQNQGSIFGSKDIQGCEELDTKCNTLGLIKGSLKSCIMNTDREFVAGKKIEKTTWSCRWGRMNWLALRFWEFKNTTRGDGSGAPKPLELCQGSAD